jgi:hypothetical protein
VLKEKNGISVKLQNIGPWDARVILVE